MGSSSASNPFPWQPPAYDPYRDCSLGICTMFCPQWCMFFPPPPNSSGSGTYFSPLVISVIVILASAFALVSYFTIFKKSCGRRRNPQLGGENLDGVNNRILRSASPVGLDESAIQSIAVYKYKKGEGLVEGTDCSVCLSEFQDDERLRLLPKCNHTFHLPCIDTWLKSHSNCPLCRANVAPLVSSLTPYELPLTVLASPSPIDHDDTSTSPAENVSADSVTAVRRDEVVVNVDISAESSEGEGRVQVTDVSSEDHTEDVDDGRIKAKTIGPSKSFRGDESFDKCINRIPVLRRAISTGGFVHRK